MCRVLVFALLILATVSRGDCGEVAWQFEESGSELPSAGGQIPWTEIAGDPITTDGRILTIPERSYLMFDGDRQFKAWNGNATGVTVEFRARIVVQTGMFAAGVFVGGQDGRASLMLSETGVQFRENGTPKVVELDATVFHTYRLVMEENGRLVDLYLDGAKVLSYQNTGGSNGINQISFGGYSGETIGIVELDYLRWTTDGAQRPESKE